MARLTSSDRVLRVEVSPIEIGSSKTDESTRDTPNRGPNSAKTARIVLSRRWVRKNPRSNAGSPAWAHSKSSKIRPPECTRMFLGLKSPRTSVRSSSGRSMRSIKASMRGARSGCARAIGAVVGVDPQLVEQAGVRQSSAEGRVTRRLGVDRAQDRSQPGGDRRRQSGRPSSGVFHVTASSGAQVMAKR